MRLTSQGVRDLNGPHLNGSGYNGRRSASCPHYRSPDVPVERREEVVEVRDPDTGYRDVRTVNAFYCTNCGERRWDETE